MESHVRRPAVAGRFYAGDPDRLARDVAELLGPVPAQRAAAAMIVAPHAGYIYSGRIAGAVYSRVRIPGRVIVLCPNHTGLGEARSLWASGSWMLPGASVPVDAELAALVAERGALTADHAAHLREHAIEVQLPLLQALRSDVRIVPICLARLSLSECVELGAALASTIAEVGASDVLIVASTDMSHYVPVKVAEQLDRLALARVLALDPEGLYEVVTRHDISMCGYVPTTVALAAARELSAKRAELVRYGNSGEVSGDLARVVGYASVMIA